MGFFWTEDILAEAVHARRRRFPTSSSKQIENVRDRLIKVMGENKISNFPHDDSVNYPDEFDAHVHSAAVHANIDIVVTDNVKDFSQIYSDQDDCPYDLFTADEWLVLAAGSAPDVIDTVIKLQHDYWSSKGKPFNLVTALKKANCQQFAQYVATRLQRI